MAQTAHPGAKRQAHRPVGKPQAQPVWLAHPASAPRGSNEELGQTHQTAVNWGHLTLLGFGIFYKMSKKTAAPLEGSQRSQGSQATWLFSAMSSGPS